MIGKAKSNKSLVATIEYNLKEKAALFFTNRLTGTSIKDYQMQMQDLQKCYQGYAKQLTVHAILSPHISEGKNLTHQQWKQIADEYLISMNLKEHQAVGFIHSDKEHRHLHLVINKINEQTFKPYNDSFIGKRTQKTADKIAEKMGLMRAMEIRQENILKRQHEKEMQLKDNENTLQSSGSKQLFKQELKTILENKNIKTVNDYFEEIKKAGFTLHLYHNKETKELRGYGIEKNDTKLDASVIGKEFTLKNLQAVFENKISTTKKLSTHLKEEYSVPKEEIQPLQILTDKNKIKVLKDFVQTMDISEKSINDSNREIEFVEQGKHYFIGMKNDSSGYFLRNSFSKQYSGEQDITTIVEEENAPTVVVEDMFDYLRLRQNNENLQMNFIILHSLQNKEKAIKKLKELEAKNIFIQLKNDDAGKTVTGEFLNIFTNAVDLNSGKNIASLITQKEDKIILPISKRDEEIETKYMTKHHQVDPIPQSV